MIHARPNMNGNDASDFAQAAYELSKQVQDLEDKFREKMAELLHGRNYQHMDSITAADHRRMNIDTLNGVLDIHMNALRDYLKQVLRAADRD